MQLVVERRKSIGTLGLLVTLFLLLGFLAPKQAEAAASSTERQMVRLINQARVAHGRAPLRLNNTFTKYARRHSRTMAAKDLLYHNPYLAKWLARYSWRILGENVGVGGSIASLHDAFIHSPGHRSNIMDRRFRSVGVGVITRNGRVWVTVIFKG